MSNPFYKVVFYDGGTKTNIRTLQNHRNQKSTNSLDWGFESEQIPDPTKITSQIISTETRKSLLLPPIKKKDNGIIYESLPSPNGLSVQSQSQKYLARYSRVTSIYFDTVSQPSQGQQTITEGKAMLVKLPKMRKVKKNLKPYSQHIV